MALVYLGLGTNLGDKELNLNTAVQRLSIDVGSVVRLSSFIATDSWGYESENEFLNAVLLVDTILSPLGVLEKTQSIERSMGRAAATTIRYQDRPIDIDILLYDNLIFDSPELKIPHPLMTKRNFVLIPLAEIDPGLIDPVTGKRFSIL